MSHTHIRVRTSNGPAKPGVLRYVAAGAVLLLVAFSIAVGPWWRTTVEDSHEITSGQVLETRIAVYGTRDTSHGGIILYRIEARVKYDLHGQIQDRWMAASEVTSNRDLLALRLVKSPSFCEVYWAPQRAENPKCLLK